MNVGTGTMRDLRRDLDDAHRAAGDVMCWCSMWVPADQAVEGTCGGAACLHAESLDRQGLVP